MSRLRLPPLLAGLLGAAAALAGGAAVVVQFGREQDPYALAALFAAAALAGQLAWLAVRRVRMRPEAAAPRRFPAAALGTSGRAIAAGALLGLILFGGLAAFAWTREPTRSALLPAGYAHTGALEYEAVARGGVVYPDAVATTGQPVFRRLADQVHVTYAYRLDARARESVRGTIGLQLEIADPATGWKRTFPLAPTSPFDGVQATSEGTIDLRSLGYLLRTYRTTTGTPAVTARVTVIPRVAVSGYAGEAVIDDAFAPATTFVLGRSSLSLEAPTASDGAIVAREEAMVRGDLTNRLVLAGRGTTVSRARELALVGVVVSLAALAVGLALGLLGRLGGARSASRIVDAESASPIGRWVSELGSLDELMRVAETYDRIVVRVQEDGRDVYLVDDGVALYRYVDTADELTRESLGLLVHGG